MIGTTRATTLTKAISLLHSIKTRRAYATNYTVKRHLCKQLNSDSDKGAVVGY